VGERDIERVGEGVGERIRELEVLLASEKESERASKDKKESENRQKETDREPPWRAGEPCFEEGRKTEKELRRERERGKLQSKRQRHTTQERGRDRE